MFGKQYIFLLETSQQKRTFGQKTKERGVHIEIPKSQKVPHLVLICGGISIFIEGDTVKGKTQKEPKELPFYSTSNATTVGGRRASAITQVSVSKQRGEQPQAKVTTADGQTRTVRIRTSTTQ